MSQLPLLPPPFPALFQAMEQSTDPVFITDRNNVIASWNEAAERLLGFGREEAVGQSCAGLMRGCDPAGNRYCTEHCAIREMGERNEVIHHFNLVLMRKDRAHAAADVTILRFEAPSPHQFFLAHILKPVRHAIPAEPARNGAADPLPRTAHQTAQDSEDARARKLTQREVEILGMLAAGRSTAQIADGLHISALTARNHIQNILDKLEVHSKAEAVAFAFQKRLF